MAIENSLKALQTFSHDSIYILANQIAENNKAIVYVTALAKADSTRSWNDSIRIDNLEQALKGWGPDLTDAVKEAATVSATVAADSALWNKAVEVADSAWGNAVSLLWQQALLPVCICIMTVLKAM